MVWVIANMAPLMFGALVLFLLFGYPVAFALAANGIVFGLLGIELGLLHPALFQALPERIFGIMANDTLLAIPFFTFMGLILERSGMAEDLLDTIGQLFGPMRGGLAYAVIFVGATPFNLLGLDRWVRNFSYITYYDAWDGAHPRVFTPQARAKEEFAKE